MPRSSDSTASGRYIGLTRSGASSGLAKSDADSGLSPDTSALASEGATTSAAAFETIGGGLEKVVGASAALEPTNRSMSSRSEDRSGSWEMRLPMGSRRTSAGMSASWRRVRSESSPSRRGSSGFGSRSPGPAAPCSWAATSLSVSSACLSGSARASGSTRSCAFEFSKSARPRADECSSRDSMLGSRRVKAPSRHGTHITGPRRGGPSEDLFCLLEVGRRHTPDEGMRL